MIFLEVHIYYSAQRVFDVAKCLRTFNNIYSNKEVASMFEFYLLRWIKFEFDYQSSFAGLLKLLIESGAASLLQR